MANWTLVTAYFDLTKMEDASAEIKNRDFNYYLNHSSQTLELDYNLVIYCEESSLEKIKEKRSVVSPDKTIYKVVCFENWWLANERERILKNRQNHPSHDPRNTASYYLFCMSRYFMLLEVIRENNFKSTHFAWINFCISRMGLGIEKLGEALAVNRDKFSTCYIDYIPKQLVYNNQEYWKWGRCSMCSGFFTGNEDYMTKFCRLIIKKFYHYLAIGYGHADETLYSPVYFENPEIFSHYYGDYSSMITNYVYAYENPDKIIWEFMKNAYDGGGYDKVLEACQFIDRKNFLSPVFNTQMEVYRMNTTLQKL